MFVPSFRNTRKETLSPGCPACLDVLDPWGCSKSSRTGKEHEAKLLLAQTARLGPIIDPKIALKKFVWVPLLRYFQEMRHINLFLGLFLGGGQKVYVDKVNVLFLSPKVCAHFLASTEGGCCVNGAFATMKVMKMSLKSMRWRQ